MNEDNQGRTGEQYQASNIPAMCFAALMIVVIIASVYHYFTGN